MNIAILGATSEIAKDLILSFSSGCDDKLYLFARRPNHVAQWMCDVGLGGRYYVADFTSFGLQEFDVILNFVGVGDPSLAAAMGASILDVTLQYDNLAINYIQHHIGCRYFFLSSGAVYGNNFSEPVDINTNALININNANPSDWYGVAKLHAELRHRSLEPLPIVDIRVFNYFSHTQDMGAQFFMADIIRAICDKSILKASSEHAVRDYIGPNDFYRLIKAFITAPPVNTAVDVYSKAPIDKFSLLATMQERFGLRYELSQFSSGVNVAVAKPYYYSVNKRANDFGYNPHLSSIEVILYEARLFVDKDGK